MFIISSKSVLYFRKRNYLNNTFSKGLSLDFILAGYNNIYPSHREASSINKIIQFD